MAINKVLPSVLQNLGREPGMTTGQKVITSASLAMAGLGTVWVFLMVSLTVADGLGLLPMVHP